jgi:hypothetical protein
MLLQLSLDMWFTSLLHRSEPKRSGDPVDEATMERMLPWWLARYSIEELLEFGRGLD